MLKNYSKSFDENEKLLALKISFYFLINFKFFLKSLIFQGTSFEFLIKRIKNVNELPLEWA